MEENGWKEYKRHILAELGRLHEVANEMDQKLDSLKEDIIVLKVKAGLIGAIAGAIPGILSLIVHYFISK